MFSIRSSLVLALTLTIGSVITCSTMADESASSNGNIAELAAMLQSIDPYRPAHQVTGKVVVYGSSSMDALAHGWANSFKEFHNGADIQIFGSNSELAFQQLIETPSGIAMLSRPVLDDELEQLKQQGLKNPVAFTVAREALAVFVHESNPAVSISGQQLREIFKESSSLPQWSWLTTDASWSPKPIHLISRTDTCGTQKYLRDYVFHSTTMRESLSQHTSNAEVLKAVGQDPLGIAICGMRSRGDHVKVLQLTAGDKVIPSDDHAVLSGEYPLTRPLTLVIDVGQSDALALASQEFVRFALCRAGQREAILVGFFPVDLPLLRAGLGRLDAPAVR
ncbi:MAG: substrate-binding domain-containing protein [Planctomycetales bacterium]|nr:substrate-binding domain-containing protein [Planctomycetales bacterium]